MMLQLRVSHLLTRDARYKLPLSSCLLVFKASNVLHDLHSLKRLLQKQLVQNADYVQLRSSAALRQWQLP